VVVFSAAIFLAVVLVLKPEYDMLR